MATVEFKKLHPDAKLPIKGSAGASCYDIHSIENLSIIPGNVWEVKTGLALSVPRGYILEIRPRSGLAIDGLRIANSPGTVDSDYRGEIIVLMEYVGSRDYCIKKGDRIAQICLKKVEEIDFHEVKELDETPRGARGFGSTGK